MVAKREFDSTTWKSIKEDFFGDLTFTELGKKYKCSYTRTIRPFWVRELGEEVVLSRKGRLVSKKKSGRKVFGNRGKKHWRYSEKVRLASGYIYVHAPSWYTGNTKRGRTFEHIVVGCQKYGVTELPKGHIIHHIDHSTDNNSPENLQLMSRSAHMKHHKNLEGKRAPPNPLVVDLDWEYINGRCSEEEYQRRLSLLLEAEKAKASETYYKQQLELLTKEES